MHTSLLTQSFPKLKKDLISFTIVQEKVLIYLTAEHGVVHVPEYLTDHKIPAGYFNGASAVSLLKSYMNNIYGKGDWIKQYHGQQIYLNRQYHFLI